MTSNDIREKGVIIKGVGGSYSVSTDNGLYVCSARGIFRNQNITPLIGDHVSIRIIDEEKKEGSLDDIQPRRNELQRPRVANVDMAVIVQAAASPVIDLNMLDRLIILTENESLDIVICINKMDLDKDDKAVSIAETYRRIGYPVELVSALDVDGFDTLIARMTDKVTVLAGPSGVGKSSIINAIMPDAELKTGQLSRKIDRGKHTTRHAALIEAFRDSYVVDTPGFSSLSFDHIDIDNLPYLFREFKPFLNGCRFNNCRHIKEIDCSIRENIGESIPEARYNTYLSLMDELKQRKKVWS